MSKAKPKAGSSRKTSDKSTASTAISSRDESTMSMTASSMSQSHDKILLQRGYVLDRELGSGSYATVRKGSSKRHDNQQVAVKVIDQGKAPREFREKFLPRELKIHSYIKHKSVVQLMDLFRVKDKIYLVLELASKGDLLDYVRLKGAFSDQEAKFTFRQICAGIQYLHESGIVHRDLKCENILLDTYHNIKISDLGFARPFDENTLSKTFCGSAAYAAPEILRGKPYRPNRYDMWSLGVILHILVNGSMPFDDSNLHHLVKCQEARKVKFSSRMKDKLNADAKELILHLLEPIPEDRGSIYDCVDSKWLAQVPYIMRSHIPTEQSIREPLTRLPNPAPSKSSSTRNVVRKRRAASEREEEAPTEFPPGFVPSSTRSLRPKNPNTASQTNVNLDTISETRKPFVSKFVKTPGKSFSSLPSEISYYDTDENVKMKIKCNAYI